METVALARLLHIPELPLYLEQVDQLLIESISGASPTIKESALRLIQGGGKRLRPILVIAVAKSQGGEIDKNVLGACAAIELVHLSTLVHDDIMDGADIRWGVPTVNKTEGMNQAIVVGDYLLALSAHVAASVSNDVAQTITAATMEICDGQSLETADTRNVNRSIDSYLTATRKKTASLMAAACKVGALCAGLSKEQVNAFTKFGESFGTAFQLIDDLLDFLSTPEAIGKPVGNDVREGVYTLPILLALQKPSGEMLRDWLTSGNVDHEKLVEALMVEGVFEETIREVKKHNARAARSLNKFNTNAATAGFSRFPPAYLDSVLKKTVTLAGAPR